VTLACDSEFICALAIGLVCGFAFGFFTFAALTISKGAGK
jgi:hypothetical protein